LSLALRCGVWIVACEPGSLGRGAQINIANAGSQSLDSVSSMHIVQIVSHPLVREY
jgi:hypothetical protein